MESCLLTSSQLRVKLACDIPSYSYNTTTMAMPRIAGPRQWICLRVFDRKRPLSTSPPHTSPSETDTETSSTDDHTAQIDRIRAELRIQNDHSLIRTKAQLSKIYDSISQLSNALSQIPSKASSVHLVPSIPPYTVTRYRRFLNDVPPLVDRARKAAERIDANLTDLQAIPYPTDTRAGKTQQLRDEMAGASDEEAEMALNMLKADEDSHRTRLLSSTAKLVQRLNELETSRNPFPRGKPQSVKAAGWGGVATNTAPRKIEEKSASPSIKVTNSSERGDAGQSKQKDVAASKENDSMRPVQATGKSTSKPSLFELQKKLESARKG